jgi:AraC-like DNA-binding protein
MLFRSGGAARALLPFVYFMLLGAAFFLDFYKSILIELTPYYGIFQWALWFYGPPLSVLLIIQIAQITRLPSLIHFWVILLIPGAYAIAYSLSFDRCADEGLIACTDFYDWLNLLGLFAGAISMLAIWSLRRILHDLYDEKEGKSRYWLVLTLIIVNLFFLSTMLLSQFDFLQYDDALLIRTIFGIAFVYLASTSLFRIYPQAVVLLSKGDLQKAMSSEEKEIASKVESLINLEKVYHEATYSRSDLARELKVSEAVLSRVINVHFKKNLPQLLNEKRIEDAKTFLKDTNEPIKVISEEVGFNSIASFNRVFKEISGITPSEYRDQNRA